MGCQHCSGQDMSIITNLEKFQIHRIFIKRQVKQQSWQEAVSCSDVALSKADSRTLCTEPPAVTSTVLETCCPSLQGHVFVQLAKCICTICKMYLYNLQNVFVQLVNCNCPISTACLPLHSMQCLGNLLSLEWGSLIIFERKQFFSWSKALHHIAGGRTRWRSSVGTLKSWITVLMESNGWDGQTIFWATFGDFHSEAIQLLAIT